MKKLLFNSFKKLVLKTLKKLGLQLIPVSQNNFVVRARKYELSSINPQEFVYPCEASQEEIELMNQILRPDKTNERISMLSP